MGREDAEVPLRVVLVLLALSGCAAPPPPAAQPLLTTVEQAELLRAAGRFDEALKLMERDASAAAQTLRARIHYDPDGPSLGDAPAPGVKLAGLAQAEELCRRKRCGEAHAIIDEALAGRQPDDLATLVRAGRLLLATDRRRAGECVEAALPLARKLNERHPLPVASLHWITATDELYADLLVANRHLGHARGLYVKALTPYRYWARPSAYTDRRKREIEGKLAALDRSLAGH